MGLKTEETYDNNLSSVDWWLKSVAGSIDFASSAGRMIN